MSVKSQKANPHHRGGNWTSGQFRRGGGRGRPPAYPPGTEMQLVSMKLSARHGAIARYLSYARDPRTQSPGSPVAGVRIALDAVALLLKYTPQSYKEALTFGCPQDAQGVGIERSRADVWNALKTIESLGTGTVYGDARAEVLERAIARKAKRLRSPGKSSRATALGRLSAADIEEAQAYLNDERPHCEDHVLYIDQCLACRAARIAFEQMQQRAVAGTLPALPVALPRCYDHPEHDPECAACREAAAEVPFQETPK